MKSDRNESSLGKSSQAKIMAKKVNYSSPHFTNPSPNLKQPNSKRKRFQLDVPLVERVSGFSKPELNQLRKKLELELHKVRSLNARIDSGRFSGKNEKFSGQKRSLLVNMNGNGGDYEGLMKMCKQILTKLMRNMNSWVFNKPVDAVGLGLYDYHHIVKEPMDLGTVKMNLSKNLYSSPSDFASDVRLTFNNAMLYNPKTDQVHSTAAQLLSQFEDMFGPVQLKLDSNVENDNCHGSSWNEISTSERPKKPKTNLGSTIPPMIPELIPKPLTQSRASNCLNSDPRSMQLPVLTPSVVPAQPVKSTGSVKAASTLKQPKPKENDPNKRAMTMEEKRKLGMWLQNLPEEKMPRLVQIIRKRNEHFAQAGDEIELYMEALDTETLWELDRFVTNWKKFASKMKRQALMETISTTPAVACDTDEALASSDINDGEKKIKKGDGGEDVDVDIGDKMPESTLRHVEIEKDDGGNVRDNADMNGSVNASSSSSSSCSDSSSSDSGSLSGSDSDAEDEVQA